jgi:hypothetical protein
MRYQDEYLFASSPLAADGQLMDHERMHKREIR